MDLAMLIDRLGADRPELTLSTDPLAPLDGIDVDSIEHDSRLVAPGALFCCLRGRVTDGHDHAAAAVAAGARALLVERPTGEPVTEVRVENTRRALAPLAAAFHDHPSRSLAVLGVTGTNGKTTVVHLLDQLIGADRAVAVIGTLTGARTTPEATELQAVLADARDRGDEVVAMEVSSHALDQHRVDAVEFATVAFTNLSQDHLEYHGTMEAYYEAKRLLFSPERASRAVINVDDRWGRRLASECDLPVTAVCLADVQPLSVSSRGSRFRWRGHDVDLPLPGRFNVANALIAAEMALGVGVDPADVAARLGSVSAPAGRYERIDAGQPFAVVVDYAHTPDGLGAAVAAARELVSGRVIVVFGAGGDRDIDKRPLMGTAVSDGADVALVTSDNPRTEDPNAIIAAVTAGMAGPAEVVVEPDRARAIAAAIAQARPDDIVLIAGKGHEAHQEIAGVRHPFRDQDVARRALEDLS